jgi:hypothetical protein
VTTMVRHQVTMVNVLDALFQYHDRPLSLGVFRVDVLAMIQLLFLSHFWSDL